MLSQPVALLGREAPSWAYALFQNPGVAGISDQVFRSVAQAQAQAIRIFIELD